MQIKKYLRKIFSIENELTHICVTICGIKIKIRSNRLIAVQKLNKNLHYLGWKLSEQSEAIKTLPFNNQRTNMVSFLHTKSFSTYKNIHSGKDVVLMAAGPTLNYYKPIEGAIHVGVNRTFMFDKVKLDYLFMEDYKAVKSYIEEAGEYVGNNVQKFYGITQHEHIEGWTIPESIALRHNASRFYSESPWVDGYIEPPVPFAYDICNQPLLCYGSITFPAMQFILYTNPRKIYLVGNDCTNNGYFTKEDNKQASELCEPYVIEAWVKLKKFAEVYYPETEIISVNSRGLRGLFNEA